MEYSGRASSVVGVGNRVILYKSDGTLIIHRSTKVTPLNYARPKSSLSWVSIPDGIGRLLCEFKGEEIVVNIYEIYYFHHLTEWSSDSISLKGTESEMVEYLIDNSYALLGVNYYWYQRELPTSSGSIDVVFVDYDKVRHIVEVKRRKANASAVYQLRRYIDYLVGFTTVGYLAAPSITSNAMNILDEFGYHYVELNPSIIWPGENIR